MALGRRKAAAEGTKGEYYARNIYMTIPTVRAGGTIDLWFDAWTRVPPGELIPNYRADNNPERARMNGVARPGRVDSRRLFVPRRKSGYPLLFASRATPRIRGPKGSSVREPRITCVVDDIFTRHKTWRSLNDKSSLEILK